MDRARRTWVVSLLGQVAAVVAVLAVFVAAPIVGQWLDLRGLPGFAFTAAVWVALAGVSVWVVSSGAPRTKRARMLSSFARAGRRSFRVSFRVPTSLRELPSFADPRGSSGAMNLVAWPDRDAITFDRWKETEDVYVPIEWWTSAAGELPLSCARLVVAPRRHVSHLTEPLLEVHTESDVFGRRFRVLTDDPRFASAFLDQRMIEWLLADGHDGVSLEVGSRWAMASREGLLGSDQLVDLVGVMDELRAHAPRVAASLFPPEDPGWDVES